MDGLSPAQERLLRADRLVPGQRAYEFRVLVDLAGRLDTVALRAALADLAARHDVLRLAIGPDGARFEPPEPVPLPVRAVADPEPGTRPESGRRPWRAELVRLGPDRHRLLLAVHHVIADDPTLALLLDDLAVAYRARVGGRDPQLAPAGSFRAELERVRAYLAGPQRDRDVADWQRRLAGLPALDLPTDRPRRPGRTRPGALLPVRVPAPAADRLRQLGGGTLAQALLAGWAAVLHRFAGRDELAIGLPVSTRRGPRRAGLYVNTLPIRADLGGNPPYRELVGQVRARIAEAIDTAGVPLDAVADGRPLFDVVFGLSPLRVSELDLPGLGTRVHREYGGHAKFDLDLQLVDAGPGQDLGGYLEYDTGLFDERTARLLADAVPALLAGAAADPGARIGTLPLTAVPPTTAPADPAPAGRIDSLFAAAAAADPERVAVVDGSTGDELTYRELAVRAGALAAELAARGLTRGATVGLALPRSVDLVVAIVGVLAAGAAYVPLDVDLPAARLAEMAERAGLALTLGTGELPAGRHPLPASVTTPDDPAYVMFTSGSTGEPKAVVVPHRAVVRLVRDADFAAMGPDERWLHAASPSFDASTLELWAPLLNGGSLVVLPARASLAEIGRVLDRHRVTSAFLTTGLFNVAVDTAPEILHPLRQLVIGGEAASADHVRRALEIVPTVVNGYGPTENTTFSCCQVLHAGEVPAGAVPIGRPIHGSTVHVSDPYGLPLPDGAVGELLAGGDGLALGYAGSPALTAERFVPSPHGPPGARLYRTGDFGRVGPGGVVEFAGRRDDQVKVRGFRIELGAVELALLACPGVERAAAAVHVDPAGDRQLVGYTVGPADPAGLADRLRRTLPGHAVPTRWVRLDALPLGPTGKVDRYALPAPGAPAGPAARPRTVVEDLLVAWYAELLGVADAGPDTDFFAVGGHSLFASRLAARIRSTFGVELSLSTVFGTPRLGDLAVQVAAEPRVGVPDPAPAADPDRLPLSPAQQGMWFLHRYAPDSAQYHVPVRIELTGPLDRDRLRAALQAVVDRHPALRASVRERAGRPYQTIRPAGTPLPVAETDLSGLAPPLRPPALRELVAATVATPFDLGADLPVRAALVRTGPDRHVLLLVAHHIAVDAGSLPTLYADLAAGYAEQPRPAPELAYPDWAGWQDAALAAAPDGLARWWQDELAGVDDVLDVPGDADGADDPDAGDMVRFALPDDLRQVARAARATPFAALLAAYGVLLGRRTGRDELLVGIPVTDRSRTGAAGMVGLFVNTLPVRIDLAGEPTFTELVGRVGRALTAALEHHQLPFGRIVALTGPPRATGRPPLVQALFGMHAPQPQHFTLGPVRAEVAETPAGTARFDLALTLAPDGDGHLGRLEYARTRYTARFAADFCADYTRLVATLGADPDAPVRTVPAPAAAPAAGPEPELQAAVAAIWAGLVGVPVPDGSADFFALGGHSLTAVQVVAAVRERLGRDVPLLDLFEQPTLAGFAARVAVAPEVRQRPGLHPLPGRAWAPLALPQRRHVDRPDRALTVTLQLTGPLDRAGLERALTVLGTRHAVLRSAVGADGQRVRPPAPVRLDDPAGTGPWRVRLTRRGPADHRLEIELAELAADDRALGVLVEELAAACAGTALPPVTAQYADYAAWQRDWPASGATAYWSRRLAGAPRLLADPAPGRLGGEQAVVLDPGVLAPLRELAAAEHADPETVALAVLAAVLAPLAAARPELVLGVLDANRDEPGTERLVGCFAVPLPLRLDLSGGPSWRALVRRVRDAAAAARRHRDGVPDPALDACVVLRPELDLPAALGATELTVQRWPEETAGGAVELRLRGGAGVLRHDPAAVPAATAARWADLFCTYAAACGHAPDERAIPTTDRGADHD